MNEFGGNLMMKNVKKYAKICAAMLCLAMLLASSSCTPTVITEKSTEVVVEESYVITDPGAVEFVWEPPIINVVDVPPGLDPEGIYYRPAHQEIVEIRQGRWKYYQPQNADQADLNK